MRSYPTGTCDTCCEPDKFLESTEDNAICTDCFDYSDDLESDYAEIAEDAAKRIAARNFAYQIVMLVIGTVIGYSAALAGGI